MVVVGVELEVAGDAEGKMSLSFVDELQAQVEKLEKKILDAEAAGKDSGGDRVALSHLKALIEHFRGQVNKSPGSESERGEGIGKAPVKAAANKNEGPKGGNRWGFPGGARG